MEIIQDFMACLKKTTVGKKKADNSSYLSDEKYLIIIMNAIKGGNKFRN
jgi:hypothetical protein